MGDRAKILLLIVLLAVAAVVGVRSCRRVSELRSADVVCEAVREGDWRRAVELSGEPPSGEGPMSEAALRAEECRCVALMELGERQACLQTLEAARAASGGDWLPSTPLVALLIEHLRDSGRQAEAADLAHQAAVRSPDEFVLTFLELELRSRLESEADVLAELRARLPAAGASRDRLALELADRYADRGEWQRVDELLGSGPATAVDRDRWFALKAKSMAGQARIDALMATFGAWRTAGGDPYELRAYYAILVSTAALRDPNMATTELLASVMRDLDKVGDEELRHGVTYRYVGALVADGRREEALREFDRGVERFGRVSGLTRDEILRSDFQTTGGGTTVGSMGRLAFDLSSAAEGDVLLVSPGATEPLDAGYRQLPIPPSGSVEIERPVADAPERWVLRSQAGETVASGTVWVRPGPAQTVRIERRQPAPAVDYAPVALAPADGRRRVFWLVLDSAEWRLVQYGRARGEMPALDRTIVEGYSAILWNEPPYTAVALQRLTTPRRRGVTTFLGLVFEIGVEIEGLNFVGRNPFEALGAWVAGDQNLFETLGAGDLVAVNMLRSFGPIQSGRQAQVVGPNGRVELLGGYAGSRPLTDDEKRRFPLLAAATGDRDRPLLEEMAGDFDSAEQFVRDPLADLFVLRVASLDVLTHSHFAGVSATEQDDGARMLHEIYRYVDFRLGGLRQLLDADDVLLVMSDHGARTALQHDERAILAVSGGEIPIGRCPVPVELQGVPRLVADLLGVETDWPSLGLAGWPGAEPQPIAAR